MRAGLYRFIARLHLRFVLCRHQRLKKIKALPADCLGRLFGDAALLDTDIDDIGHQVRQIQIAGRLYKQQDDADENWQHIRLCIVQKLFHSITLSLQRTLHAASGFPPDNS